MIAKSINATTLLVSGIAFIILGICLFFINQLTLKILLLLLGILILLSSFYSIIRVLWLEKWNQNRKIISLIAYIRDLIIGIFILIVPNFILHSFAVCFGLYLLLHTVINTIEYFIYRKHKIKGRLRIIFNIFLQLFFLIPLLFNGNQNIQITSIILGIYLIGYGITHITDFFTVVIPKRTTDRIKQQIQIPLPVIFNAFIPKKLITLVNEMVEVEQDTKQFDFHKHSSIPDIYVLIHLARRGTASMGHMEIVFDDHIYSYGNYDLHSRSLFDSIGDGIILVANKEQYIDYMVNQQDRYIIEFGLSLTEKEREIVKQQLHTLVENNTEPYYPDIQLAEKGRLPDGNYNDISSDIYRYANGVFYKIKKGKYKKFFVLKTNCAMVVQYVLSSIGKQILCVNGIITPGAYYDYLNARFKLKNTNVITRKIYTKETLKKKNS